MKKLLLPLFVFLMVGCHKVEQYLEQKEPAPKICNVREQSLIFPGDPSEPGATQMYFNKTYYPDGSPKTLYAIIQGNFGQIDTLDYYFIHSTNRVDIRLYARGLENFDNPYAPDTLNFTASFDPASGYVIAIGEDEYSYVEGKLMQAGQHTLEYDPQGNLIYLKQMGAVNTEDYAGLQYEYDYSLKAGKNDLYKPAGLMFGRNYCLAEIMGWAPSVCKNVRTKEILHFAPDYIVAEYPFEDHVYNADSLLTSFKYNGMLINNKWECRDNHSTIN